MAWQIIKLICIGHKEDQYCPKNLNDLTHGGLVNQNRTIFYNFWCSIILLLIRASQVYNRSCLIVFNISIISVGTLSPTEVRGFLSYIIYNM